MTIKDYSNFNFERWWIACSVTFNYYLFRHLMLNKKSFDQNREERHKLCTYRSVSKRITDSQDYQLKPI